MAQSIRSGEPASGSRCEWEVQDVSEVVRYTKQMAFADNGPRDALAKNGPLGHALLRPGQERWGEGVFQDWHSLSQQEAKLHVPPFSATKGHGGGGGRGGKGADVLRCGGKTITILME